MIRVMDYGMNLCKHAETSASAGAPADIFRAATLNGAKALGRDDLGRLAPGSKADITVIDLSRRRVGPIDDPIRTMIYSTGGAFVRDVFVDGRQVVADGEVPSLDAEQMRRRGQAW